MIVQCFMDFVDFDYDNQYHRTSLDNLGRRNPQRYSVCQRIRYILSTAGLRCLELAPTSTDLSS